MVSQSTNEILSVPSDKICRPTLIMNKKRFAEFSNYLEGFTQRIILRYPDSRDFVNDEKTQMLGRFPELASVQPESQPRQISVIECTLTSLMKFHRLVLEYLRLLQCELPLNFFQKNFSMIETVVVKERRRFGKINI